MKDYNILYVDDERANLNSFKSLFRRKFNIITAISGNEGLEILEAQPIHLIIADQRMPNMTGIQFFKKVKKKWAEIKLILLTGFYDNKVILEAVNDVGIYSYMNKPFENQKIELVIRKGLEVLDSERLLYESEEKFRGVFNSIADVFVRRELAGNVVMVSPSVFKVLGYTPEELLNNQVENYFVDPRLPGDIKKKLLIEGGTHSFEVEVFKKDGKIITVSSSVKLYFNDEDSPLGIESVFRDVTEQKRTQKALAESEKKFKGVFDSIIDVFVRRDLDHKGVLVSPSVFEVTGYTAEDILGQDISKCFVDPAKPEWIKEYLLKNDGVHTIEFELYKKDGTIIDISSNAKIYNDNEGNPIGIESVLRDVTGQKKAEGKIIEYQERLKALSLDLVLSEERMRKQIAIDLHDDVGQLLSASRMQIAAINYKADSSEIKKKIDSISQGLLQAIRSTREAIFNLSPPQLNEIGLYAAIHDWMKGQIENKYNIITNITGKLELYPIEETARLLLFRSLRELMMNVVKHAQAKYLNITFKTYNQLMEIMIEDDGVGFDQNQIENKAYGIFSIRERMLDLGGSMEIDSKPGVGTKIKLTLPIGRKINNG